MSNKWILIRGLTRGDIHWGIFPDLLIQRAQKVELLEIPGNGTLYSEQSPTSEEDVIAILTSKSLFFHEKEKYNILAISLGGMIALKWTELYPEKVNNVFIINSSLNQLSPFYERLIPKNYFKILNALLFKSPEEQEEIILQITSNNQNTSISFLEEFKAFSRKNPFQKKNFIRQLLLAKNIKIGIIPKEKVRIIYSKNDRLVNYKCSINIANYYNLKIFENSNAGHDLPLDDPEWLINTILD